MTQRLVEDTLGTLELTEDNGYIVESVDLGFPTVREVSVDRVNANGSDDSTMFYGPRAVTLVVAVVATAGVTRKAALDKLRAYASPSRRPAYYFDDDGGDDERRVQLRGSNVGWPLTTPAWAEVQLAFVAPDGIIEEADATVLDASATIAPEAGRAYPRTYDLSYPETSVVGAVSIVNRGTEPAAPVLQLWGPCSDPWLENITTGEKVAFTGLTLSADQYAEVDVANATALLNSRADQKLFSKLDLANTTFWWLQPGTNYVRYGGDSFDDSTHAVITYRSAWL